MSAHPPLAALPFGATLYPQTPNIGLGLRAALMLTQDILLLVNIQTSRPSGRGHGVNAGAPSPRRTPPRRHSPACYSAYLSQRTGERVWTPRTCSASRNAAAPVARCATANH